MTTVGVDTPDIGSHGLIGDMSSAALVATDGTIDWCCMPRFDSPSVFAALLDSRAGGRFRISPVGLASTGQEYLRDTNILRTSFTTATGTLSVTDFMPVRRIRSRGRFETCPYKRRRDAHSEDAPHEIHRVVRCESGEVEVECVFEPRLDYARGVTTLRPLSEGVQARGGRQTLSLLASVPLRIVGAGLLRQPPSAGAKPAPAALGDRAVARFRLRQGETATFVLAYGHGRPVRVGTYRTEAQMGDTRKFWQGIVSGIKYDGAWSEAITRSLLVLHLMMYRRTGAIIAAPTTSLPETLGGSRNWDYRFAWLRDSSFTVDILYRMGDDTEGDRYIGWLLDQCKLNDRKTRIVYGETANSSLRERTLDHLEGYAGSRPVRIGNGAARHLQLDVFGEVILAIHTLFRLQGRILRRAWALVTKFAETVIFNWRRRDRGVWEVRGRQRHFVYSKIMCWAALDRAAHIASTVGEDRLARRWSLAAETIRQQVLTEGWSDKKRAFRQRYGDDALDASNLVIPFLGFLPPDDPRIRMNADAIARELADGPFVWRYLPSETDDGLDAQEEGAFTLLSFWLIGNLIYTGRVEKAAEYFEQVMSHANHLGLFSEMIDPSTGALLGNFPQAYSHVGLIHTARNLDRAMGGELGLTHSLKR